MRAIETHLADPVCFRSLYRNLARGINRLPFDDATIKHLQSYKRHKYETTSARKVAANPLYYTKKVYYYLNVLAHVTYKAEDDAVQELLQLAYSKSRPAKVRYPEWYMRFVNWNKHDTMRVYEKNMWPHSHMLLDQKVRTTGKGAKPSELEDMRSSYKDWLERQRSIKNADTNIIDLFPHLEARPIDPDIPILMESLSRDSEPFESPSVEASAVHQKIIQNLAKFLRSIKASHPLASKVAIQELKIIFPPTAFGLPIPKSRAKNMVLRKISYFKNLMYYKIEPILLQDLSSVEDVVDGKLDKVLLCKIAKANPDRTHEEHRVLLALLKKRFKNYARNNYAFDFSKGDSCTPIFSKFRLISTPYYEIDE